MLGRLLALRRRRRPSAGEDGFTLIELVIASGLMAMVLSGLAYTGTLAFTDAAVARQRTVATQLANQAIERVRALPYNTVALGLSSSELASGTDSAVSSTGGVYRYGGERIPNGNNAPVAPLVPHRTGTTIDGSVYTVAVYVTYYNDVATSRAYRVTVDVTWDSALRPGIAKSVQTQTVIYSPSSAAGSGSNATHPFSAPFQPFLYANSTSGEGQITFAPTTAGGTAIQGLDLGEASMWLPTRSTNMAIEQVDSVASTVRTSGASITDSGGNTTSSSSRQTVTAASDSDPSQPKPVHSTSSTGAQSSSTSTMSAGSSSLQLTSSSGDASTATATVSATAINGCANAASPPVNQLDALACGNAVTTQGGSMTTQLNIGGLGAAVLASVDSSGATSAAHTNRDVTPQPSSCRATSGDGCIHASHRSSIGTVAVGGLPATLQALAPAFTSLISLENFTRTVTAEAGVGAASPTVTSTGTIRYWNGVGYTSLAVASGASATIPLTGISVTNGATSTTISITGTMRTGGVTTGTCANPCAAAEAEAESPIVGDIRYVVVVGGTTVADITIHVDLGTLVAHAEYTAGA